MDFKDYYKILGVDKTATAAEIKKAFRKLARQHHPDVNPTSKDAAARFQEVSEAHEVLGDPEKRTKYDQYGIHYQEYEQWLKAGGAASGIPFEVYIKPPAQSGNRAGERSSRAYSSAGGAGRQYTNNPEDLEDLFGNDSPYSDFFQDMFSGSGGNAPGGRTTVPCKGRDIEGTVTINMEEAFKGASRVIDLSDEPNKTGGWR